MYSPIPNVEDTKLTATNKEHNEKSEMTQHQNQSQSEQHPPNHRGRRRRRRRVALAALTITVWLGSIVFAIFTAGHYLRSALWLGQWELWDLTDRHLYRPGQPLANTFMVTHLCAGVFLMLAGPVQLIPTIRKSYGFVVHRVTGRLYIASALVAATSVSTFVMLYRTSRQDIYEDVGNVLLGCLVIICAMQSFRTIRFQKDVQAHKWWSYRLYAMIVSLLLYRLYIVVYFALLRYTPWHGSRWIFESLFFAFYIPNLFVVELYKRVPLLPATPVAPAAQQVNGDDSPHKPHQMNGNDDEQAWPLVKEESSFARASSVKEPSVKAAGAAAARLGRIILYSPTLLICATIFVALTTMIQMVFNWVPSILERNVGQSNDLEKPYD